MNHVKKYFENFKSKLEFKYEEGDYVYLTGDGWNIGPELKIIKQYSVIKNKDISYKVSGYDIRNKEFKIFWVDEYEIERKLTPKEIETFKIKIEADKYNI